MQTGTIISGVGHAGLIGWMLLGGLFLRAPDPLPLQTSDVTILSSEEFAALTAPQPAPSLSSETPAPEAPTPEAAPAAPAAPDTPPETTAVPGTEAPAEPDTSPDTSAIEPLPQPTQVEPETPLAPEPPAPDPGATLVSPPETAPKPKPAPRVAPTPAAPPAPDTEVAETVTPEVSPDASAQVTAEPKPATAPEEATTEIVTEAEKPSAAPTTSTRPKSRPERRVAAAEPTPDAQPTPTTPKPGAAVKPDAVNAALAEALGSDTSETAKAEPSGPPLTSGEKDALRVAVQACWNVGSLSTDALNTTVVVLVSMSREGKPDSGSLKMTSYTGGSEAAARQAFEAARRAIIRCGANGFNLPVEKYSQWQEIEMTFNPDKMRIK